MALMHCSFNSEALGIAASMDAILPEQARLRGRPVSVLYLLHGLSDDHTIWQRRTSVERYAASLDLAVIMPAVNRSFYANMVHGPRYWTFISEELPALAQGLFALPAERERSFVAGLSMGGYGALKLALTLPARFAAAASMSGAVDVAARAAMAEGEVLREYQDRFGDLDAIRGSDHDLFTLAASAAVLADPPRLYQCCGTEDSLHADNVRFRDHARGLGLNLTYEEGPGGHDWGYWDQQIQRVLAWLPIAAGSSPA